MRNLFKTPAGKKVKTFSFIKRKPVKDVIDTDEDRVINQFNTYLNYITRLRNNIMRSGSAFIGLKKRVSI